MGPGARRNPSLGAPTPPGVCEITFREWADRANDVEYLESFQGVMSIIPTPYQLFHGTLLSDSSSGSLVAYFVVFCPSLSHDFQGISSSIAHDRSNSSNDKSLLTSSKITFRIDRSWTNYQNYYTGNDTIHIVVGNLRNGGYFTISAIDFCNMYNCETYMAPP